MAIAKIHVKVDKPVRTRKFILESAKEATNLKKHLNKFKKLRKKKLANQKLFKEKIIEIREQFQKIITLLPELPKEKKQEIKIIKSKTIKKQTPIIKNKIEQELDEINKKLNKLDF